MEAILIHTLDIDRETRMKDITERRDDGTMTRGDTIEKRSKLRILKTEMQRRKV